MQMAAVCRGGSGCQEMMDGANFYGALIITWAPPQWRTPPAENIHSSTQIVGAEPTLSRTEGFFAW